MPTFIQTADAPTPIAHYSQAAIHQGTVYLAGQIGLNRKSGQLEQSSIEAEVEQALKNCAAVLKAAGSSPSQVFHVTIYLIDMGHFKAVNAAYAAFFGAHKPARAAIAVAALPKQARVEFSMTAGVLA